MSTESKPAVHTATPLDAMKERAEQELAEYRASELRAQANRYKVMRWNSRKWLILKRKGCSAVWCGVRDVEELTEIFQGTYPDCAKKLAELRALALAEEQA